MPQKCTRCKKKWAVFNWPSEIVALFCKLCMIKGMIDVVIPKCADENCGKQPRLQLQRREDQCTAKSVPSLEWKMSLVQGVNMKGVKSKQALARKEKRKNGAVSTSLKVLKMAVQMQDMWQTSYFW